MVKEESEIKLIKYVADFAAIDLKTTVKILKVGITVNEVATEVE